MPHSETFKAVQVDCDGHLLCPHCGETYGMEEGDVPVVVGPDRDEYDSPAGTRGGWIETRGVCSCCGHTYSLVIANHKGALCLLVAATGYDRGQDSHAE